MNIKAYCHQDNDIKLMINSNIIILKHKNIKDLKKCHASVRKTKNVELYGNFSLCPGLNKNK